MRHFHGAMRATAALAVITLFAGTSRAVVGGQVDNFEGGTVSNWQNGPHLGAATNISTGGPAGAGDNFVRISSSGVSGSGGKLVVFNHDQWAGDYLQQQITAIRMDVNNLGSEDLTLRLIFADSAIPTTAKSLGTVDGVLLQDGSGWQTISFPITDANLDGTDTFANLMSHVVQLNLVHAPDGMITSRQASPDVAAILGFDNVTAVVVPEPGAVGAAAVALAGAVLRRGRRRGVQVRR
jgi:hypothetical protein